MLSEINQKLDKIMKVLGVGEDNFENLPPEDQSKQMEKEFYDQMKKKPVEEMGGDEKE